MAHIFCKCSLLRMRPGRCLPFRNRALRFSIPRCLPSARRRPGASEMHRQGTGRVRGAPFHMMAEPFQTGRSAEPAVDLRRRALATVSVSAGSDAGRLEAAVGRFSATGGAGVSAMLAQKADGTETVAPGPAVDCHVPRGTCAAEAGQGEARPPPPLHSGCCQGVDPMRRRSRRFRQRQELGRFEHDRPDEARPCDPPSNGEMGACTNR